MRRFLPISFLALMGCAGHADLHAVAPPVPGAAMTAGEESSLYLGVVDGLIQQKRYQAAIAFLAKYQKTEPQTPKYFKLVGDALSGAGQHDQAIAAYRRLLKTAYSAQAYNGIGRAQSAEGKWAEAAQNFRLAAQTDPTNASYLNNFGYAQLKQNFRGPTLTPVVAELERAHELDPGSRIIRDNLALALAMSGNQTRLAALLGAIPDAGKRKLVAGFAKGWTPAWAGDMGSAESAP